MAANHSSEVAARGRDSRSAGRRSCLPFVSVLLGRRARREYHRSLGRSGGRGPPRLRRFLGRSRWCSPSRPIARARCLRGAPSPRLASRLPGRKSPPLQSGLRVRNRKQPPRGSAAPGSRTPRDRVGHEDPREVPPGPRGGALRAPPRRDVRQGLPARLRGVSRPRRAALRGRVQLPLRDRRGAAGVARAARRRPPRRRSSPTSSSSRSRASSR